MRAALAALPLLLAACVSGRDCAIEVPEAYRADVIRFALDRRMVTEGLLPREDVFLALGAGTPASQLSDARRIEIAPYVAGYTSCVKERIDRSP